MISKSLCIWLLFVACLRALSIVLGIFNPDAFRKQLFDQAPQQVTELYGRTFASWTSLTCCLCILSTIYRKERGIQWVTLFSFVVAFIHFITEKMIFRTMSTRGLLSPGIISGVSMIWIAKELLQKPKVC